jgi:hypothetical protein
MWYDDNPKLTVAHKIEDAIAAYAGRLGAKATLVLVNEEDLTEYPGVQVRAVTTVRRNTYWVGQEPRPDAPVAEVAPAPAAPRKAAPRKATPAVRAASAPVAVAEVAPAPAEVAPATPVRVAKNRPAPSAAPAVTAEITPEVTPATPRRKTRASA